MGKKSKFVLSHVLALLLVIAIIYTISSGIKIGLGYFNFSQSSSTIDIASKISLITILIISTIIYAKYLRSHENAISIGVANIPNIVYDPEFDIPDTEDAKELYIENKSLKKELDEYKLIFPDLIEEIERKDEDLEDIFYISETFIRHHKNSSRLLRSLVQLIDEGKSNWQFEFFNNVLDECVTVLHQDRADKSSTIYFINNNELEMVAYNRIEFESARTRKFKEGEGFAGHIWKSGETQLVSNVKESEFFRGDYKPRHGYGSIIGLPIKIGAEIVGVLCIQSEGPDEFNDEDIHTLKFYADICALAYFYGKMGIGR